MRPARWGICEGALHQDLPLRGRGAGTYGDPGPPPEPVDGGVGMEGSVVEQEAPADPGVLGGQLGQRRLDRWCLDDDLLHTLDSADQGPSDADVDAHGQRRLVPASP